MMNLCDIREIRALLSRHGFRFSKSMGQNFLVAGWVPREIAAASGADGAHGVLEIGPGIGCLTRELCALAGQVVSVELDKALLPVLAETMAGADRFTLIPGDILKLDVPALVDQHFQGLTPLVCANLPYNITTPAITALIEAQCFFAITVMIQKEVAQRICAQPGTKDYGAFSVFCQYHTAPELLFEVPPDCFLPAPKVTSAVVRMVPRPVPAEVDDPDHFFRVVKAAFALRRKTLLNSLAANLDRPREDILRALEACGVPPDTRGERLSIPQFAQLSKALRGLI